MKKLSAQQQHFVNSLLTNLDKMATAIEKHAASVGLDPKLAAEYALHLDKVADGFQTEMFGQESLTQHQAKMAKVLKRDKDEPYMDAFQVQHGVVQADSDEPYMDAFSDDQSSAVALGKDGRNKPLTPGY